MAPAVIPAWVMWTGLAVSAAGAVYAGYTANQNAKFSAKIASQDAAYQKAKGKMEEEQHLDRLKKSMAMGKVATAKAGVSMLSGSAQDVFDENLEEGLFDAVMIRHGAQQKSRSLISQASQLRAQGKQAMVAGVMKAGSTLMTGAESIGGGGGSISYKGSASQSGGRGQATVGL